MTIGSELQQAREQRGLTLVQISERTKIRVPVLRAIERDDFKQLPGGVIARGFVRLFAREVGLDADEIGARFTAEIQLAGPERPGDGSTSHGSAELTHHAPPATSPYGLRLAVVALAAFALLAGVYYGLKARSAAPVTSATGQPEAGAPASVGTSSASGSTAAATTPPAAAAPASPLQAASSAPAPAANDTSPLRVDLHATDACWISVIADGEQVAFRSLSPGERVAFRATGELVLRIGIPWNLVVSINEQRMPPSTRPGTPITLRITPANYRDLLKP
jgi:cytoskeletal protein RodZ